MMGEPVEIDLAYALLDHQLVDEDERRCGKVDDVELSGSPGEPAEVAALLVGPGWWPERVPGPLGRLAARLGGDARRRVPWSTVTEVTARVQLAASAQELGLGQGDDRAARLVRRLPGA
jgi:hypothetical protein